MVTIDLKACCDAPVENKNNHYCLDMQILTCADIVIMSYNISVNEQGSLEALHTVKESSVDDVSSSSKDFLSHKVHLSRKMSTALFEVEWHRLALGKFDYPLARSTC